MNLKKSRGISLKREKITIPVQDESLAICCVINDYGSDETIVYIPGHTDSSYSFEPILEESGHLSNRYNYMSFDIAWGDSDISRQPYTKDHHLTIINSVLEHIVQKELSNHTHLAGHSMGGELTLLKGLEETNKKEQDNFYTSAIKTLSAIAPATYPRKLQLELFDFISLLPNPAIRSLGKAITPRSVRQQVNTILQKHETDLISDEQALHLYDAVQKNDGFVRIFDVQRHMHFRTGSEHIRDYKTITLPLQFIMGDSDTKISKRAIEYIAQDFPDHPLHIYKDCSHFMQYQYPEQIAKDVISFAQKY